MSSGVITLFAMLAFLGIVVWVFLIKRKEDFDEQARLPLDEDDRAEEGRDTRQDDDHGTGQDTDRDHRRGNGRKQESDKEESS